LLAISNLKPAGKWADASYWVGGGSWSLLSRDFIKFWNEHYGQNISSGSYDDVRRRSLVYLVEAGVAIRAAGKPDAATNDPTRRYALSEDAHEVITRYGTPSFAEAAANFVRDHGALAKRLVKPRTSKRIKAALPDGTNLMLSPGRHNELQTAIIEVFLPTFAPDSQLLYLGDTSNKLLLLEEETLRKIGFFTLAHDKLPDIVALDTKRNWLFLIEAVTSSGPVSPLRHMQLEELTAQCSVPRVYLTAFLTKADFRKFVTDISWETEVWIAESPGHLIHFDGERFLGPY
jgi:type II restriction enzyme